MGASQEQQQGQAPTQPTQEEQAALQKIIETTQPQQRLELVEEFLREYPESLYRGRVFAAAAESYHLQSNFAKTILYGERALQISPHDASSMMLVADSLAMSAVPKQTDFQEKLLRAEDYARQALEIMPELLASIPRRPEMPEEQYKLQERYMLAVAHGILGLIYLRRDQFTQAGEELKQATELNEMRPDPVDFQRLGFAQMRQKKFEDARAAFERCMVLDAGVVAESCEEMLEHVQARGAVGVHPPREACGEQPHREL